MTITLNGATFVGNRIDGTLYALAVDATHTPVAGYITYADSPQQAHQQFTQHMAGSGTIGYCVDIVDVAAGTVTNI